jgi:hypothetical protein
MEIFYSICLPDGGRFDVESLAKHLESDPAVVRDPDMEEVVFILCVNPESADRLKVKLAVNPQYACDTYGVITLKPDLIWVSQNCCREIKDKVAAFVLPLLKEKHCTIGTEYGEEITDRYRGNFESLFYDEVR